QQHIARPEPRDGAVAHLDLRLAGQCDRVLPTRGAVPVQDTAGQRGPEGDTRGGDEEALHAVGTLGVHEGPHLRGGLHDLGLPVGAAVDPPELRHGHASSKVRSLSCSAPRMVHRPARIRPRAVPARDRWPAPARSASAGAGTLETRSIPHATAHALWAWGWL